jgi:catechol-2,3-dioxygenase
MAPTLQGFDHIHVFVTDRAASEEWYARVMGLFRDAKLEPWSTGRGPLTIGNESGTVHLALFERRIEQCRSVIAFNTTASEFLAWRAHLTGVFGRTLEAVDHELSWSLYFTDPDGNPFEITSYEYMPLAAVLGQPGA